jgi:cell wall-associated NlpC family hydrolase
LVLPDRPRLRLVLSVALSVCVALSLVAVALPQAGQAAPKLTLDQVRAELALLNTQAETAQEALNQTRVDLVEAGRSLDTAKATAARAQAQLDTAQVQVGRLASALYRSGGMDQSVQVLFATNPTQYLQNESMLAGVTARQADVLRLASTAHQRLDQAAVAVNQHLQAVSALHDAAAAATAKVNAAIAQETALLASLEAAQRAELAREAARAKAAAVAEAAAIAAKARAEALALAKAAARAAAAAAAAAHPPKVKKPKRTVARPPVVHHKPARRPPPPPATSGSIGARVVAYALAQVGDAYVWGAAGPSSWDCSGLTMRAYAQVGVWLPHSSSAQSRMGRPIAASALQPGDLVFYYSPIHHVGIYIGGGMIVNAENPSVGVTITGLYSMPYSGAVRPY